jgi:hypothetical protein
MMGACAYPEMERNRRSFAIIFTGGSPQHLRYYLDVLRTYYKLELEPKPEITTYELEERRPGTEAPIAVETRDGTRSGNVRFPSV